MPSRCACAITRVSPSCFSSLRVGVKVSGREERDFADLFYMPDIEAVPPLFADWQRYAPGYAAMSSGQLEEFARERHM